MFDYYKLIQSKLRVVKGCVKIEILIDRNQLFEKVRCVGEMEIPRIEHPEDSIENLRQKANDLNDQLRDERIKYKALFETSTAQKMMKSFLITKNRKLKVKVEEL